MSAWTPSSEQDQISTLFDLGYFKGKEWDEVRSFMFRSPKVQQAIGQYEDFHRVVGEEPSEHMLRPRCGLPDFVRDPQEAAMSKWRIKDVTTSNRLSGLSPLSAEREQAAWLEAIAAWNAVCGIQMTFIDDMSKANIYANPGSTGPGVLAYSYLPNNSGPEDQMQQVYNRSTNWSYALLLNVIIHEIGHAIGLDHGPHGSIMQPTAAGDILLPMAWDIEQARIRYGSPDPKSPTPRTGFAMTVKSRISAGGCQLVPDVTDYDLDVATVIQPGRYRVVNEFQMG